MSKPDFANGVRTILSGTTTWAQLTPTSGPNQFSEKYQVDLTLDAKSVKEIESLGVADFLNIKDQEGVAKYDTLTVRIKTNKPPQVFDRNKAVFDDYIHNGSVMRVAALIKAWEYMSKKGLTCYFNQGVVLEAAERQEGEGGGINDALFNDMPTAAPVASAPATDDGLPF
tara:strand:+ start:1655 stop:2164 length:510 start_codon:yes stop_codon:yes gene_type:complete